MAKVEFREGDRIRLKPVHAALRRLEKTGAARRQSRPKNEPDLWFLVASGSPEAMAPTPDIDKAIEQARAHNAQLAAKISQLAAEIHAAEETQKKTAALEEALAETRKLSEEFERLQARLKQLRSPS